MKSIRAIIAFVLFQSYTLTTLAASLLPSLSISNTNVSFAPSANSTIYNTLHLPSDDYVLQVNSEGNVTIHNFDGDFVVSTFHTYHLLRLINHAEIYADDKVSIYGPTYHMGTLPLDWGVKYKPSESQYSTTFVSLFPLETMTFEHMRWAMKALGAWVMDKTVETSSYTIDVEGVGMVGMGQVMRTDFESDAD